MGLLDSMDDPTMALAMGLLGSGGYSRMPVSTGQGLAAGYGAWQEAKRAQQQKALQDLQAQHMSQQIAQLNMQMDAAARALKTKELLGQALRDGMGGQAQAPVEPYGGGYSPSVSNAFGVPAGVPRIDTPKQASSQGYADRMMAAAMKAGDVDAYNEAAKMKLEEKKLAPKFATDVRVVSIGGKPTPVQMADDGSWRPMGADVSPAEKLHFADNGHLTGIGIDQYSGKVMSPGVQKLQSPDSIASNAVTMRGQNMTDARSRESLNFQRDQANKPQFKDGYWVVPPTGSQSSGRVIETPLSAPPKGSPRNIEQSSNKAVQLIDQADKILNDATGSYIGAGADIAAQTLGISTKGAQTTAKLKALEGALMMAQPRMEGPQSDKDVALYRQMAGQIGDPTIPIASRRAALNTIRELHAKYTGGANQAPKSPFSGPKFLGFE